MNMDEVESPRHPLSLLCEDAWLEVLKYVDSNPRDMISLHETCTYFQYLLESTPINGQGAGLKACQLEEVAPLLIKWLPKEAVLRLRLVCRRVTTKVVDKLINENRRIWGPENLGLFPRLMQSFPMEVDFPRQKSYEWGHIRVEQPYRTRIDSDNVLEDITRFEKYLAGAGRLMGGGCPNLGGGIFVHYKTETETYQTVQWAMGYPLYEALAPRGEIARQREFNQEFARYFGDGAEKRLILMDRLVKLFSKFPNDFKYVTLISSFMMLKYQDLYQVIRNVFESLPNLHSFEILHYGYYGIISFIPRAELEFHLSSFIPLPPCPNLETIRIAGCTVPEAFLRQIAEKYGSQLKTLNLDVADDETIIETDQRYEFPALLKLTISLLPSGTCAYLERMNAPQLKILDLDQSVGLKIQDVNQLIQMILAFPSVVQLIHRLTPNSVESPEIAMEQLATTTGRHQNLISLELGYRVFESSIPLKFFTRLCPNVEKIKVEEDNSLSSSKYSKDRDFNLLYKRKFEKSNIWREATNLKNVKFEFWDNGRRKKNYIFYRPAEPIQ